MSSGPVPIVGDSVAASAPNIIAFPKAIDLVEVAYQALERQGFTRRSGQEDLSRKIHKALLTNEPLCAEAATGTGKTFAYLIGGILAQEQNGLPLVVSTATVALQEQIFYRDLPTLAEAGLIAPDSFALSKGRNRYFCVSMAREAIDGIPVTRLQPSLFGGFENETQAISFFSRQMWQAWAAGNWNGDRDSWPKLLHEKAWAQVRAERGSCSGNTCPDFHECPFYQDRLRFGKAQILVANHSLVLADLAMRAQGRDPLFPYASYQLLVDEAHHLPEIVRQGGETIFPVRESQETLGKLGIWLNSCQQAGKTTKTLPDLLEAVRKSVLPLRVLAEGLRLQQEGDWFRFAQGKLDHSWSSASRQASGDFQALSDALQEYVRKLRYHKDGATPLLLERAREFLEPLEHTAAGLLRFSERDPVFLEGARWVESGGGDLCLRYAPLQGKDLLTQWLWSSEIRPILVSATLQSLGTFDSFREEAGLPPNTQYHTVPPVLPYRNSVLHCPPLDFWPTNPHYPQHLAKALQRCLDPNEGTLILFNSRQDMLRTISLLPPYLRERCLIQGQNSTHALIEQHRQAIAAGKGSILVGLQSFSEGLDLPGELCTHVVLTRLPFKVPGTPLEEAKREKAGSDWFRKGVLPSTARALVQMAGRLVRRTTDQGRITCLDARLRESSYGSDLLQGLPDFQLDFGPLPGTNAIL